MENNKKILETDLVGLVESKNSMIVGELKSETEDDITLTSPIRFILTTVAEAQASGHNMGASNLNAEDIILLADKYHPMIGNKAIVIFKKGNYFSITHTLEKQYINEYFKMTSGIVPVSESEMKSLKL